MPSQNSTKMSNITTNNSSVVGQFDIQLPSGFAAMETQVAGHTFDTAAVGILQDNSGCVLKPFGKPECGARELNFYESLQQAEKSNEPNILMMLRSLVPKYHKIVKLVVNNCEHTFLKMEDLTYGMKKPCIMDIKIGERTWDPIATEQKRRVEEQKYARCKQVLGLCLPGFQVYTLTDSKALRYSKEYGKKLDADGFRAAIALFINAQNGKVYRLLVYEILKQLYRIRDWFKVQTLYNFYASSLLLVYDFDKFEEHFKQTDMHRYNGIPLRTNGDAHNYSAQINFGKVLGDDSTNATQWVKVKMIDFAHVFPADGTTPDHNYIFGLENLIMVFEELMER
ncbi:inositol polyphosphate multikinase [Rhagoletis pomonella]|uniref:inositol polyphosphate multikinase n=1 Tax=Rhagoletis pomonella TaxID=28610 RepID=UPI00177FAB4A|nr:inositol polyphosphate multikinase [Rhagoletis pomonella]